MQLGLLADTQHESMIDLLCELHAYYNSGAEVAREMVRRHLLDHLLAAKSPHRLVVASDHEGTVLGLAAITLVFSLVEPAPDKNRHCQLKELFVRAEARNQGVGKALMVWITQYAWDQGCRRIDWPVKASNSKGIAFYESLGAERVMERLSYRLNESEMARLATQ